MTIKTSFSVWLTATFLANVAAAQSLKIIETDHTITVMRGDRSVLTYNKVSPPAPAGTDPIYERSGCLHPVMSPKGRTVTAMFPFDHPHQNGIFSAWVKTTYDNAPIDFWNLAGRTGRVLHERVISTSEKDGKASFEVDLLHRKETPPTIDILRERWKITVYPTPPAYYCFSLELTQTAITDKPLLVQKNRYGGLAVRGPARWLTVDDSQLPNDSVAHLEPCEMLNDSGSDRIKGNHEHAKWVALSGLVDGKPVTIVVLNHPGNFRSPQAARLHPTKPYFCFAPCVDGSFRIDRDHPYRAKYRFLVTDVKPDVAWINQQWKTWSGM